MAQPFIGQIKIFGGNFAPAGYAFCDGALMAIADFQTLFQLIGTTYGGDGQTTFAVPDLRGRVPVHQGTGAGLTARVLGQTGGTETVTLTAPQMPAHSHPASATNAVATQTVPTNNVWAYDGGGATACYSASPNASMSTSALTQVGGSQPHENMQPYLGVNYIISLYGIFPSQ